MTRVAQGFVFALFVVFVQNRRVCSAVPLVLNLIRICRNIDQRLSLITLAVRDLAATGDFYCNCFGWTPLKSEGDIAFFRLNGSLLTLFPAPEPAKDAGIPAFAAGYMPATLAICLRSEQEVIRHSTSCAGKG